MNDVPTIERPKRRGGWTLRLISAVVAVAGVAAFRAWAVPALQEDANGTECRNNLKQLGLAFRNYHDSFGSFPHASVPDLTGKPIHSWRVALQPYLDCTSFYNDYQFREPWDSPQNRSLAERFRFPVLSCPSSSEEHAPGVANYVVIVGRGTAFPDGGVTSLADITDGPENTILVAENARSDIFWSEPRDLRVDEMSWTINDLSRPSISSAHPRGPFVGFADGSVARLDPSIDAETLRALTTIAGGEPLEKSVVDGVVHARLRDVHQDDSASPPTPR